MARRPGPIDDFTWADTYAARVLSPNGRELHGYDVEADLARNYSFPELILTALTGAPPEPAIGDAFGRALSFLSVIAPAEAPIHTAELSRLIGAQPGATVASACLGRSERASSIIAAHKPLLDWLDCPNTPYPRSRDADEHDRESLERLRAALAPTKVLPEIFDHNPTRTEALLGVLHACGIRRPEQLITVWTLGAMASAMAEALAFTPLDFPAYPLKLPDFDYIGDIGDREND
jgi:hypothetical protein